MPMISPYCSNGSPQCCAGCGQPFAIRAGQPDAIVGEDGNLYCYDFSCQLETNVIPGPPVLASYPAFP